MSVTSTLFLYAIEMARGNNAPRGWYVNKKTVKLTA